MKENDIVRKEERYWEKERKKNIERKKDIARKEGRKI